ncbi:BNR repeat-containing protein [Reichenbachiella ulvae]|uniref:BNR repeat-containing protein n=1 Tax=Reichenbachiella ulvae TaxID=2980104 RepID=A0ABT3CV23_9BACT|nr:BNR repeat-containing protein [Reichenbachiella ulvae]MCV9387369.1 BNR repeat-containing protein [Reichenbachiella ulvae]
MKNSKWLFIWICLGWNISSCERSNPSITQVGEGWASNSVNAVIFRRNSLSTYEDTQYASYYDKDQNMVLAKRPLGSDQWQVKPTQFKGNTKDAHNSISIAVDGEGFLHVAWDHHNTPLRYSRSVEPGSLELKDEMPMTGEQESDVTYPEFYRLPSGDLLFLYRSGESGNGNLVMKRYDVTKESWSLVQDNLIDGEGQRNAYWQACVDGEGTIHLSWVWRETWDVATNHDLCYARSKDGGLTWENSKGEPYSLPINISNAEVAWEIPQKSELINQTSMTADAAGQPIIASYWKEGADASPQYHIVYKEDGAWKSAQVSQRQGNFSLSGGGTKKIPISRPQVLSKEGKGEQQVLLLFRDEERDNKVSVFTNQTFPSGEWEAKDLTQSSVGSWEPSYDTELWKTQGSLSLFVQKVTQVDGEGLAENQAEMVYVLDWDIN